MAYIIENALILKEKGFKKTSLLMDDERIVAMNNSFKRYRHVRMDASPFIMTPSHVVLDSSIPLERAFPDLKKHFIDKLIMKGCTTFITFVKIESERELAIKLKQVKAGLMNSPLDFIIGVQVVAALLTPSFVRKCKKEKIPAIFVEIDDVSKLMYVPWGWTREAMFPYNSPLIPVFSEAGQEDKKIALEMWETIMKEEKIPHIATEITERTPIPLSVLKKIGIYPKKSNLQQGGEASYNFYEKSREIRNIEENDLFHYYNHKLIVTVHKGTVIRAGEKTLFRPGFGEHVEIKTPAFFLSG